MDAFNFDMAFDDWTPYFDPYPMAMDDDILPPFMPDFMDDDPAVQPQQPKQPIQPQTTNLGQPTQPQVANVGPGPFFPTPLSTMSWPGSNAFGAGLFSNPADRNAVPQQCVSMEQVAPNPENRVLNDLLSFVQEPEQPIYQQAPHQVTQQPQPQPQPQQQPHQQLQPIPEEAYHESVHQQEQQQQPQQQPRQSPKPTPQQEPQMDEAFPYLTALAQTRAYYNGPNDLSDKYRNKGSWPLLGTLIEMYEGLPDSEKPPALRAGIFNARAIDMQLRRAANKLDGWRPRFERGRRAGSGANKISKRVALHHDKLTCTALDKLLGPLPPAFVAGLDEHIPPETKKQKARAAANTPDAEQEAQQLA